MPSRCPHAHSPPQAEFVAQAPSAARLEGPCHSAGRQLCYPQFGPEIPYSFVSSWMLYGNSCFFTFWSVFWSPSLPPHWSWSKPSQGLVKFFPRAAVQCRGLDGPGCHTVSAARRAQLSGQGWAQT